MSQGPALLLIDLQLAVNHPSWGVRNQPHAELRAARLLGVWRRLGWPLLHIRHDSRDPASTYRPGQPLHAFQPLTAPLPGETVIAKRTGSAFQGTTLLERLRELEPPGVFVCGVKTNNSVESTVRAGGDLGLPMYVFADACFTFAAGRWTADEVHEMALANLDGEYARVTRSERFLASLVESRTTPIARQAAAEAQRTGAGDLETLGALLSGQDPELLEALAVAPVARLLAAGRVETLRFLAANQSLDVMDMAAVAAAGGPMDPNEAMVFEERAVSFLQFRIEFCRRAAAGTPDPGFAPFQALVEAHLGAYPSAEQQLPPPV